VGDHRKRGRLVETTRSAVAAIDIAPTEPELVQDVRVIQRVSRPEFLFLDQRRIASERRSTV